MKNVWMAALFALPLFATAQDVATKAAALVNTYAAQKKFSGDVLIAKNDQVIFHQSAGLASIEKSQPVTAASTFRIGSLTKMFTAALVLHAAEKELLSLEDPVSRFVPSLSLGNAITIHHLLSHTSGIAGNTPPQAKSLGDMIHGFKLAPAAFAPGARFEYNNFNYMLLTYILEKTFGQPYSRLLKTKLLDPAGMKSSGIDSAGRLPATAATGYTIDPSTNTWVPAMDADVQLAAGAGAMYSTTADLLLWSKFIRSGKFISESLFRKASTVVQADYGLGFIIRNLQGHPMIGHTGTIRGFNAALMYFPQDSLTVIYTANFQDMDAAAFEKNLYSLALSLPYRLPVVRTTLLIDNKDLQQYAGTYRMDNGAEILVEVGEKNLLATAPGGDKIKFIPEAPDKFYMEGLEKNVTFGRKENAIISMTVDMGGEMKFVKVK